MTKTDTIIRLRETSYLFWSPDGKWISFDYGASLKIRAESVLWAMDIEKAVARVE